MKSELLFKSDSKDARAKRWTEDYFQRSGTLEEEGKGRGRGGKNRGEECCVGRERGREEREGCGRWGDFGWFVVFCVFFIICFVLFLFGVHGL